MSDDEMQKFRTKMRENAGIKTDGSNQNPINSLFAKKFVKKYIFLVTHQIILFCIQIYKNRLSHYAILVDLLFG